MTWLYYKRLENSKFNGPSGSNKETIKITQREFRWLRWTDIIQKLLIKKLTKELLYKYIKILEIFMN